MIISRLPEHQSSCGGTSQSREARSPDAPIDPAVSSGDFSRVVEVRKLCDQERYHLLTNHFHPAYNYSFPSVLHGNQRRCFQYNWLLKYNGLVYSEIENGGYCKYCILFDEASPRSVPSVLTTLPLTNFQKASEKLREHFTGIGSNSAKKYHLAAVERAENFKAVMEKKAVAY